MQRSLKLPRIVKFGGVGMLCLGIQLLILHGLDSFWPAIVANAIGFVASAQLNFVLSNCFTWVDTRQKRNGRSKFILRWGSFNANVLAAVGVNGGLFGLMHHVIGVSTLVAAIAATIVSSAITYLVNHFLVFNTREVPDEHSPTGEHRVLHARAQ